MPSYKTAFGSYLKAEDLQGKAVRLTLDHVALEDLKSTDGKVERRLVGHFAGKDKTLVINRTNADTLASLFGEDYDDWAGPVVLFPDTTMFGGKRVACLRVRAATAKTTPAVHVPAPEPDEDDTTPITDDDIPF
jgi:hypothetical protein